MRVMRVFVVLVSVVFAMTSQVFAQTTEPAPFSIDRFRPASTREGLIDVELGAVADPLTYDVHLWFNYAQNPLVVYDLGDEEQEAIGVLVGPRFSADLAGGVVVYERLAIGMNIPLVLFQERGEGVSSDIMETGDLASAGLGDISVTPKVQILTVDDHHIDLALMAGLVLPTGAPANGYFGDPSVSFIPELAISRPFDAFTVAGNFGFRWRLEETSLTDLTVGSELLYRLGVGYDLRHETDAPVDLALSLNGSAGTTEDLYSSANQNPLETFFAVTVEPADSILFSVGMGAGLVTGYGSPEYRVFTGVGYAPRSTDRDGDGIRDSDDACPDDPEDIDGFEDVEGCPDPDNDQDGIVDVNDACPDDPEDLDLFEDEDGCPDPDNDQDGLLDVEDECPNDPEDYDLFSDEDGCPDPDNDDDGLLDAADECPLDPEDHDLFEDENGCPDPDNDQDTILDVDDSCPNDPEDFDGDADEDGCPEEFTEVTEGQIEIWVNVNFETDSDVIMVDSYPILDEVFRIINSNPTMVVRVEGHTDDRGSDDHNLDLSQRRAGSVCTYLNEAGIERERLVPQGFGETVPIATNDTRDGRAANRRVEFHIIEQ